MFSFSFIKEVHFNLGPLNFDFSKKKDLNSFGWLLFIVGFVLYAMPSFPIAEYLPKFVEDVIRSLGMIFFVPGFILLYISKHNL